MLDSEVIPKHPHGCKTEGEKVLRARECNFEWQPTH